MKYLHSFMHLQPKTGTRQILRVIFMEGEGSLILQS